jgi:hypothetical protein
VVPPLAMHDNELTFSKNIAKDFSYSFLTQWSFYLSLDVTQCSMHVTLTDKNYFCHILPTGASGRGWALNPSIF